MSQSIALKSADNRPRRRSRPLRQTPTELPAPQETPRRRPRWRNDSEHRELRKRRMARERQREAEEQGSILADQIGDGGERTWRPEERRDSQEAGKTPSQLCQEMGCKVLRRRTRFSHGALAPVGLADFLEGDLNINQLESVDVGSAEARSGERSRGGCHSPFQWYWDRPMPDIVTGAAKARTPLTEFGHEGHERFWDIRTARWNILRHTSEGVQQADADKAKELPCQLEPRFQVADETWTAAIGG